MLPTQAPLPVISSYHVLPIALPSLPSHPTSGTHYLYLHPHEPRLPTAETPRSLFLVNIPVSATEAHLKKLFASAELGLGAGKVERVDILGGSVIRKHLGSSSGGATAKDAADKMGSRKRKRGGKSQQNSSEMLEELQAEMDSVALPSTWDREVNVSGAHAVVVFVDRTSLEVCLKGVGKYTKKVAAKENTQQKKKKHSGTTVGAGADGGGLPWPEDSVTSQPSKTTTPPTTTTTTTTTAASDKTAPLGLHRYTAHRALRYPPRASLAGVVQEFMTHFSAVEAEKEKLANAPGAVDEDGFVTVTRGPKAGNAADANAAAAADTTGGDDAALAAARNKKSKKDNRSSDLVDFYRFQMRDKRKEREIEMRKRFEQDKMRVREMRERRRNVKPE